MEKFFKKIKDVLGDETEEFINLSGQPPYRGIRLNTLKCDLETLRGSLPFELKGVPWCKEGFYLPDSFDGIGNHPLHCAGGFYVQEPSAMSAVRLLNPLPGDFVLDLCAAPGGKSTQIAAALQGEGLLWSNEVVTQRAGALISNLERIGAKNAVISSCHPQKLCENLSGFFDKILVDAPCSGEGMFRKYPDTVKQWMQENVEACAHRQLMILESAKLALKSGGVMLYSTCTFSREENEGVIEKFLERNPEFELDRTYEDFGRSFLSGTVRIFPMDGGEGHFAARLRHRGEQMPQGGVCDDYIPSKNVGREIFEMYDSVFRARPFGDRLIIIGDKVTALPKGLPSLSGLGVLRAGVVLGEIKKNRVEPLHTAFMAAKSEDCMRVAEFKADDPEIFKFLKGEEIALKDDIRGYTAVCVEGIVTGFGKASNGVLKNKYPKGLRLLR